MARATDIKPYMIEFESFVTGHHVCKAVWSPFIGESSNTQMELDNALVYKPTGPIPPDISPWAYN